MWKVNVTFLDRTHHYIGQHVFDLKNEADLMFKIYRLRLKYTNSDQITITQITIEDKDG